MGTLAAPSITSTARGPISGIDGRQAVAIHTDGTQIAAYKDGSVSLANIKVATSANNGDTWTQVANITAPVDTDYVAIGQFADGSIALVARSYDAMTLRYAKVTFGTWAVSAWETILTISAGGTLGFYDVDVSDTGVVLVAFQYKSGATLSAQVRARGTGGSWANLGSITMYTAGVRRVSMEDISVVALASTGGVLNAMVACASGTDVKDYGIRLWTFRVTESTGAIQTAYLLRSTFDANSVDLARTSGRQHRCRLFRVDGASEALLATWTIPNPTSGYGPRAGHYRANWAASSYLVVRDHVFYATPPADATTISSVGISANANRDLVFHLVRTGGSSVSPRITGQVMTWDNEVNNDPDSVGRDFSYFATTSDVPIVAVSDGPRRNLSLSRMDFIYQYYIQSNGTAPLVSMREAVPNPGGASAITSLTPADGSSNVVATPALKAVVDTEVQFSQSDYRIHFEFATDSTFTTNLIDYVQSTFKRKPVNGTSTPGVTVTFSDTLPDAYNLTLQTWFYRARLVDIFGNVGAWTPTQSFIVGHPPSITPVSPSGGGFYNWNGGVRTHTWNFWDPSSTDYQTAYELQIELEDGTVVFNSAKVSGAAKSQSITLAAQYKDVLLGWKARGYDSDDTAGQWSPLATYVLTDPTVATIDDPTPNKVYATGIPTFLFTPTTGGGRSIRDYTVVVTQGKNIIWSKRVPAADIASGQQQAVKMDQGYLKNNQNYSMQVVITDSGNIQGSSPVVAFSTAWVPPAAPSGLVVNSSQYNKEDEGYVQVGWDDVNRDPDFVSWALYRKDDLIDAATGLVLEAGEFKEIFRDYSTGAAYIYRDYFAPSNYRVTYRVIQSVNRLGQDIDSMPSDEKSVVPQSDGYWLIEPSSDNIGADAFKLSIVTGDSFSDEQEESEFTVIGRGRIVNKGQRLGYKGTLDVQLRDTGGTTARQKRLRLVNLQQTPRQLWLRNPFGDIFRVNISAISIGRIAGVGSSEFCDVSIPYSEVS